MSLRERTAWIATLSTIVIWSYYFATFWFDVVSRQLDGQQVLWRFIACMVVMAVVMIGLNIAAGVMTKKEIEREPDEMERTIEGRADRIGFRVLEWLIPIALIPGLLLTDAIKAAFPADPGGATALIFANGILLVVVLTEVVRELLTIVSFRMTA
jgi:hypothetical protein